jgi:hypothetical protein
MKWSEENNLRGLNLKNSLTIEFSWDRKRDRSFPTVLTPVPVCQAATRNKLAVTPWLHPSIEVRPSKIAGKGIFATKHIQINEIVLICGGQLFCKSEISKGKARPESLTGFDEGIYIGMPSNAPAGADEYLNHSCEPNLWLRDEVTLIARRRICPGEELTADYATWEIDENWLLSKRCNCGSANCRRIVTGRDWRLESLRTEYHGHFLPCLKERIIREVN